MKDFNLLTDSLPDEWGGVKINTDYRQVLRFERLIKDNDIDLQEKSIMIVNLFFEEIPAKQVHDELWDFITYYVNCGEIKEESEEEKKRKKMTGEDKIVEKKTFDFDADHGRIYAAFLQTYGIDLTKIDMHWWVFKELLDSISDDTKLMKVIDIRGREVSTHDSNEYKMQLIKLKELYSLDEENKQPDNDLSSFFFGGRNGK